VAGGRGGRHEVRGADLFERIDRHTVTTAASVATTVSEEETMGFKLPHALITLFWIILLCSLLT
jgi:hypothetical protein